MSDKLCCVEQQQHSKLIFVQDVIWC